MGTVKQFPPSQQDLHAFVDDELSQAERTRIMQWLSDHPDQRRELLELRLREILLRNAIKNEKQQQPLASADRADITDGGEKKSRSHHRIIIFIICGLVALLLVSVITGQMIKP